MKRYLLIFMGVLSFFFFSDSVSALSFTASNGYEYEVDSEERLLDYCYYVYIKEANRLDYSFSLVERSGDYYFLFYKSDYYSTLEYQAPHNRFYVYSNSDTKVSYSYVQFASDFSYTKISNDTGRAVSTILYSSNNIFDSNMFDTIYFPSNISSYSIESRYGNITLYTITYYLNNEVYQTVQVESGTNYLLLEYTPPKNYRFNGWEYDENIDLTNISSDINIYGTTTYIRPDMNYSENIDSVIHELSVSIIGKNVPVEFDYIYTVMDFIILLVLVFCVIMPFVLVIKLLSGRW